MVFRTKKVNICGISTVVVFDPTDHTNHSFVEITTDIIHETSRPTRRTVKCLRDAPPLSAGTSDVKITWGVVGS